MRRTILIADDELSCREALAEAFERRGYRICLAGNGQEAIAVVRSEPVTLAIFDYQMPRLGGLEALCELRKLPSPPPVVITTSLHDDRVRREAFVHGASGFFWKPVDLPALRGFVRDLIGEETAITVRLPTSVSITVRTWKKER